MSEIELTILGSASSYRVQTFVPKGGKYPVVYTPKKVKEWKAIVNMTATQQVGLSGWQITDRPVRIWLIFGSIKPKSWKKSDKEPYKKPDLGSLERHTIDALKGVVYTDDARICQKLTFKVFADKPFCYIKVEEI